MSLTVAVAGKGGTGKTTFCALLVRTLVESGVRPVLAVDADPNSNLAEALGVPTGAVLADIRERGARPEGSPASGVGRARAVGDEIQKAVTEADGFDVVTMGRPEGPRCYCYVNGLLRASLDGLSKAYAAVVIDNEAGMEHLSRRTTNNVDVLVGVMNPTEPSLRAVRRILSLSRELPVRIAHRALLVTRAGAGAVAGVVASGLEELVRGDGAVRLPDVPQDGEVERLGAEGGAVSSLRADAPALAAVRAVAAAVRALAAQAQRGLESGSQGGIA